MDARLVARIQRKDHAAYDELVAQYGDVLFSYIFLSMHDRQQSEALLGAALLRGIEQIDRYNPAGPAFLVWLYRIAQTVLRDTLTATPYKARVPQRAVAGSTVSSPAPHALWFESPHVHEAFTRLALEERQVIILRCIADMSLNEVGYVLAKSNSAVKQLQFQALGALRELMM
jgi:RNA polymerase sigma-70 factor, ECF subfamily